MKKVYKVTWGEGQSQSNLIKSEAIKIAADLLNTYAIVTISRS